MTNDFERFVKIVGKSYKEKTRIYIMSIADTMKDEFPYQTKMIDSEFKNIMLSAYCNENRSFAALQPDIDKSAAIFYQKLEKKERKRVTDNRIKQIKKIANTIVLTGTVMIVLAASGYAMARNNAKEKAIEYQNNLETVISNNDFDSLVAYAFNCCEELKDSEEKSEELVHDLITLDYYINGIIFGAQNKEKTAYEALSDEQKKGYLESTLHILAEYGYVYGEPYKPYFFQ